MSFRNGSFESVGFDNWMTPIDLLEEIKNEFGELFDPCPKDFDYSFNGLEISWSREKADVRFIKGRLKFIHPDGRNSKSAPFPSILCLYGCDE